MSQSFHQIWLHYIWSTKDRQNFINSNLKKELISHIKEYGKTNNIYVNTINGDRDDLHLLIKMKPSQSPSQLANLLKGESSNWINQYEFLKIKFSR